MRRQPKLYVPPPEPVTDQTRHWRYTSTGDWVSHPRGWRLVDPFAEDEPEDDAEQDAEGAED
jgi:hypothetical protein